MNNPTVTKPDMKEIWLSMDKWFQALPQHEKDRINQQMRGIIDESEKFLPSVKTEPVPVKHATCEEN